MLPALLSFLSVPRQAGEERTEVMIVRFAFQQTAVRLGAHLTATGRQVDEACGADQGGEEGGMGWILYFFGKLTLSSK